MPKSKTLEALRLKVEGLDRDLRALKSEVNAEIDQRLKSVEFVKCSHCKSKLETRFRSRGLECPVCGGSFANKGQTKALKSLEAKRSKAQETYQAKREVLFSKVKGKGSLKWLIGGWCSS